MAIEGGDALEGRLENLDAFHDDGVRLLTLVHDRDNELGYNQRSGNDGPLSRFGIDHGIDVLFHCGGGGFKAQMKKADASGAAFAVIIGDDEAQAGEVTLKPLRSHGEADGEQKGEQKRVSIDVVADEIMNSFLQWEEE